MNIKPLVAASAILVAAGFAAAQGEESVQSLIKKLGSSNFKDREAATKALLERPDAEVALRAAMRAYDLEFSRRAAAIVEKLEWRRSPLRKLEKAVGEGRIESLIELVGELQVEKDKDAIWKCMQSLCSTLTTRCAQTRKPGPGGGDPQRVLLPTPKPRMAMTVKQFSQKIANRESWHGHFFLVTEEVDYNGNSRKRGEGSPWIAGSLVIANGPLRIVESSSSGNVFLARGQVQLKGHFQHSVILCCSDVVLNSGRVDNCLIIVKGTLDTTRGRMDSCSVMAGKTVKTDNAYTSRSTIVENDANPLGYIRWSDPPKDKAAKGGKK